MRACYTPDIVYSDIYPIPCEAKVLAKYPLASDLARTLADAFFGLAKVLAKSLILNDLARTLADAFLGLAKVLAKSPNSMFVFFHLARNLAEN